MSVYQEYITILNFYVPNKIPSKYIKQNFQIHKEKQTKSINQSIKYGLSGICICLIKMLQVTNSKISH